MTDTAATLTADRAQAQASQEDAGWLLEGLRRGEEGAYEALAAQYSNAVYNLVYRLVDDPADANDVVQEVFLKVFRNVGSFRGGSTLKTWIYRIAINEAHNQHRWFGRHRKNQTGLEACENPLRDSLAGNEPSPFDLASGREARVLMEAALGQVSEVFREALILRDLEDLNYEEISEVLGISLGTVKSRIQRGREALRKALSAKLAVDRTPAAADWSVRTAE
ncbi:MAG: sigma-70 family RNA polymerase sigma factor [Candidatus Solibacter usitatus]|nr:sigma-70 family RNA polymerase sigma factor [Candidatus Solibacter usitatus]